MVKIVPASKSEMIRAQILKSWKPELTVLGETESLDVVYSKRVLENLLNPFPGIFYFGDSALGLRLWMARLSRDPGEYILHGTARLMSRPHTDLIELLDALSVKVTPIEEGFKINSKGWKIPQEPLTFDLSKSSQYASAILMNAWNLESDLRILFPPLTDPEKESYLGLTLGILDTAGMSWQRDANLLVIPSKQKVKINSFSVLPDMSTAFTMAAWAVVSKSEPVRLKNFPLQSLQPDFQFVEILKEMGAEISQDKNGLTVNPGQLGPIDLDLTPVPDLFPVLSVLCGLATGDSHLLGNPKLRWKESDRLAQAQKLLRMMNRSFDITDDGITIHGRKFSAMDRVVANSHGLLEFDPDQDHRFVMAAQTAKYAGFNIKILYPEAINKTAPELLPEVLL